MFSKDKEKWESVLCWKEEIKLGRRKSERGKREQSGETGRFGRKERQRMGRGESGGQTEEREKRGRRKARQKEREGGFFDLSSILKKTMVLCISNYFRQPIFKLFF